MSEHPTGAPSAEQPPSPANASPSDPSWGGAPAGFGPGFGPGFSPGAGWSPQPWPGDPRYAAFYPYPGMGYPPPAPDWGAPPPWAAGHASAGNASAGQGHAPEARAGQGRRAGVGGLVEELANGGNGLSSLSKMLDLDDPDFWKGALLGAAAVLLLTNDSVRGSLFKGGQTATTKTEPAT